jgi:hypothetical protein
LRAKFRFLFENIYAVAIVALVVRLIFVFAFPEGTGDTATYFIVAQNILEHGCVSMSDPLVGDCVPHWGGNHLPLYPALIALFWFLIGEGPWGIQIAQTVLYVGALIRLYTTMRAARFQPTILYAVLWCMALSPLQVAYARFILPQTLSQALVVWFCAELIAYWKRKDEEYPWLLLVSCSCAIFMRYSGLCLLFPLGVYALRKYTFRRAIFLYMCWGLLILSPLALWSARSVSVGLPFPPRLMYNRDLQHDMSGLWRWIKTWETEEQDELAFTFFMFAKGYSGARVPEKAFLGASDRDVVTSLLNNLKKRDGHPIPRTIDTSFGTLADNRIEQNFWRFKVGIVLKRMALVWFKPQNGMGWPTPGFLANGFYKTALSLLEHKDLFGVYHLMINNASYVIFKIIAIVWRGLLVVVLLVACLRSKDLAPIYQMLIFTAAMLAISQSIFLGIVCGVDSRLIAEIVPLLETANTIFLCQALFKTRVAQQVIG